jgi:predicted TIM-barrel fold metal-dependent hydrolase
MTVETNHSRSAPAETQHPALSRLIDVHHHIIPPFYLAENRDRIAGSRGGEISAAWLNWTPEAALVEMDKQGVSTAIVSLSSPSVWFGNPQAARQTARRVNDYAAELVRANKDRFGMFASLPLPDTDGSLREIEYALDVLKADGVVLLTSYDSRWLGDPAYSQVFEELNRREAVVFVHPTVPVCCRTLIPDVSPFVAEVPQDTARAITNLLYSGSFGRYRDIRFIFCHGGGTLPSMMGRLRHYGPADLNTKVPNGIEYELKRLYFDIASSATMPSIAALMALVPTRQILLGSDYPYVPLEDAVEGMTQLGLNSEILTAISRENALRLFPRLSS